MESIRRGGAGRIATLAAVLVAAFAADASAATIGQTGGSFDCTGPSVSADVNYEIPAGGGEVTSFSFQSIAGNAGQQLDFLVLRPSGATSYTVVGRTGLVTLAGTGLETFPSAIFAQSGDIIAFWQADGLATTGDFLHNCYRDGTGTSVFTDDNTPDPAVGGTVVIDPAWTSPGLDVNEAANLAPDTTPPTCQVTAVRAGPPKQQDVTVIDDSGTNVAISNIQITNGTTSISNPSPGVVVVTATKADPSMPTVWSFDATDPANNTTHCG